MTAQELARELCLTPEMVSRICYALEAKFLEHSRLDVRG